MSEGNNCQGDRRLPGIATSACGLLAMTDRDVIANAAKQIPSRMQRLYDTMNQIGLCRWVLG